MKVYRIAFTKHTKDLSASGKPARWNSDGVFILYSSSTRSLACLEHLIRRNNIGTNSDYECMVINIPDRAVKQININSLPVKWSDRDSEAYKICRSIGDEWVKKNKSLALKVPSAIIKNEFNILININHPEKDKIRLAGVEPFKFDPGLL